MHHQGLARLARARAPTLLAGPPRGCTWRAPLPPGTAASWPARQSAIAWSGRRLCAGATVGPTGGTRHSEGPSAVAQAAAGTASQQQGQRQQQQGPQGPPRLLVFGGNGFVGSRVCEEGLRTGLSVVSVNRSGRPQGGPGAEPWADQVEWVQADVFDVGSWRSQLEGALGVVSCLGAFGSNDFMQRICGDSNSTVFEEASRAGVPRAAFISVHDFGFPSGFLRGYFGGKRSAERTLERLFPDSGVALRPGFIHGNRRVGGVGIPLGLVGVPLDKALSLLPVQSLAGTPLVGAAFVPPVSVQAVAKAAVAAATDPSVPRGPLTVWDIKKTYES